MILELLHKKLPYVAVAKANLLFLSYYLSLEILSHYLIRVIICGSCGNDPNHPSTLVPLNAAIQCVCYIAKLKIIISFYIITGCVKNADDENAVLSVPSPGVNSPPTDV